MNHILLATDGSQAAQRAATYVAPRAKRYGSAVTLLHVSDAETPAGMAPLPAEGVDNPTHEQVAHLAHAWEALDVVAGILRQHDLAPATHVRQSELFEQVICRFAEERDCDLVVVGRRGLSPILEMVYGSVSDAVLRRSRKPVLVVP